MSELVEAVARGDVTGVRAALAGRDETGRRRLGDELTAYVRGERDGWWWGDRATALAVAAVGCLGSAAKVAALLGRRSVSLNSVEPAPVLAAGRECGVSWLPELGQRLAARLTPRRPADGWSFAATLLKDGQLPPPTTDPFVEGWVVHLRWSGHHGEDLLTRLRADPFLDALTPRLFEVDGVGTAMGARRDDDSDLPAALARLAAEGRLDRAMLLDGCLGRLLRGDRPTALRPFVALYDLLAPTPAETVARAGELLRLLTDAPGPVAVMAQRALRAVADELEAEALLAAARVVLTRPEKALVRAELSGLDRLARRRPDRVAEIAAVLAVAADHPAAELRDRAAALAQRHGHRVVASVTAGPVTVGPVGDDLPAPVPPAAAAPPITDADELAEEVVALFGSVSMAAPVLERVLDGLVRLAGADPSRLAGALRPVLDRQHAAAREQQWPDDSVGGLLSSVLLAATGPAEATARRGRWTTLLTEARRRGLGRSPTGEPPRRPLPQQLLLVRLAELGERLGTPADPGLLAAPTAATGGLDPTVLYERLAALGDRPTWRWDLTQALLRLPGTVDEGLAAKAAALGTPAGDRLAEHLRAGGPTRPTYRLVTVERPEVSGRMGLWWYQNLPVRRTLVEAAPAAGVADPLGLLTVTAAPLTGPRHYWAGLWPSALPAHRGLLAAHLLPTIASAADEDARDAALLLPALADCGGPGGPAVELALAYGLAARHEADRVAALDALLILAGAGELDAAGVGGHLGTLAADGRITLGRVGPPLRDAAAAGARASTWRLLAAALPPLLAAPTPPRGTPDLLTLAAQTAAETGLRLAVPGLADVAARGGGSRLVTEARRLATALHG
jgi:hypothetical protein